MLLTDIEAFWKSENNQRKISCDNSSIFDNPLNTNTLRSKCE